VPRTRLLQLCPFELRLLDSGFFKEIWPTKAMFEAPYLLPFPSIIFFIPANFAAARCKFVNICKNKCHTVRTNPKPSLPSKLTTFWWLAALLFRKGANYTLVKPNVQIFIRIRNETLGASQLFQSNHHSLLCRRKCSLSTDGEEVQPSK